MTAIARMVVKEIVKSNFSLCYLVKVLSRSTAQREAKLFSVVVAELLLAMATAH